MPQIRLTNKSINELKSPPLKMIGRDCQFFDDWYLDIFRITRKKTYLFMHVETKVAFAIPSFEIGGVNNLFECFALLLQDFFMEYGDENLANRVYTSFIKEDFYFIKNKNKSMVPYTTQFKHRLLDRVTTMGYPFNQGLCDVAHKQWLNNFITVGAKRADYITPLQLMNALML